MRKKCHLCNTSFLPVLEWISTQWASRLCINLAYGACCPIYRRWSTVSAMSFTLSPAVSLSQASPQWAIPPLSGPTHTAIYKAYMYARAWRKIHAHGTQHSSLRIRRLYTRWTNHFKTDADEEAKYMHWTRSIVEVACTIYALYTVACLDLAKVESRVPVLLKAGTCGNDLSKSTKNFLSPYR